MSKSKLRKMLKKAMPRLSQSEAIALEAGGLGFEQELFTGKPNWDRLLKDIPAPSLTKEEQAFLDGPTEELCGMIDQWAINNSEEADLPKEVWDFIKTNKFLGMEIPKKEGGLGFSHFAHSAVIQKLASRSVTAAVSVMVPNSLGPGELIHRYGTKKQKEYYLPRLAKGEEIPAFALTEPNAGSDATSVKSDGVVFKDEKGEIKIKLNWSKRYITLGPISTLLGLAFQLEDPDNLLGKGTNPGITAALIDTSLPGVNIGKRHRPVDIPFQNGPNWGEDVIISPDDIIGGAEQAGGGWKMLMECLGIGRCISLPTLGTAGLKTAAFTTGAYSHIRRQFGLSVGKFEGVEEALARIAGQAYIADATLKTTLQILDDPKLEGKGLSVASAILKYHLTEMNRIATDDAMDVHGGKGICQGPNNYLATNYQAMPIGITVEGANIMTRTLLIFGQGSTQAHPYVPHIMKNISIEEPTKADDEALRGLLYRAMWNGIANFGRSLFYGMTNGRLSKSPTNDKDIKRYYQKINRLSAAFNISSNIALANLGGDLKKKEHISKRLGDVFSSLYMASCVLRKYEIEGSKKEDLPLVQWACDHLMHKAEDSFAELSRNYPLEFDICVKSFKEMKDNMNKETVKRFLKLTLKSTLRLSAKLMTRLVTRPFGTLNKRPTDRLGHKVARSIFSSGEVRDRLTNGIYVPKDENDAIGKLVVALKAMEEVIEPLEKKMREGGFKSHQRQEAVDAGVLSKTDLKSMKDADQKIQSVVDVDFFDSYSNADAMKPNRKEPLKAKKGGKPKVA